MMMNKMVKEVKEKMNIMRKMRSTMMKNITPRKMKKRPKKNRLNK